MLRRTAHANGVVTYTSPRFAELRIPHGFTTRIGGVSQPPYAGLCLQPAAAAVSYLNSDSVIATANGSAAPPVSEHEAALQNFDLAKTALGCRHRRVICAWQVHGDRIVYWPDALGDLPEHVRESDPIVLAKADVIVTTDRDALLAVRVADCAPVLIATRTDHGVAAIHAGWRGVAANVAGKAVFSICNRTGVEPSEIIAAIGPCIRTEHFEVGPEVAEAFVDANLAAAVQQRNGWRQPHIDLVGAIQLQLERAGVCRDSIDTTDRCTFRDRDEFFSHRRDRGRTGRMAAFIGVPD